MEFRELGRTGLRVSSLCLGTMTWGEQNSEADGHAQMDYAIDQGINFFDTAEAYAVPPRPETAGRTEEIIGSWFRARGGRDRVILATKVAGRGEMGWLRKAGGPVRLDRAQIAEAVDGSLRRLGTDYIDLYQLHWPDRKMHLFGGRENVPPSGDMVAFEETLGALDDAVGAGKIRHIGLSNETPWGVSSFLNAARDHGLPRIVSVQNAYNLVNRVFEDGLAEFTFREGVSLLAYSPLAQGYLTGKYQDGALPPGARKTLFNRLQRYEKPGAAPAIDRYVALARRRGLDPAQMALQFVTTRPFVAATIIGATTMEQLKVDVASTNVAMTADLLEDIEAIHHLHPNPCP